MADADWEVRLKKLEEDAVVNGRLINLLEQRMDRVQQTNDYHQDRIAELNVVQKALFEIVDSFIRGKDSDGHK